MNKEKILAKVEEIRVAGQQKHTRRGQEHGGVAWACHAEYGQPCKCAAAGHNDYVDLIAKSIIEELYKSDMSTIPACEAPSPDNHKGPWFYVVREITTHPSKPQRYELVTRRATCLTLAKERMDIQAALDKEHPDKKRGPLGIVATFNPSSEICEEPYENDQP
ncbi:MAG: hypothetical protein M0R32_09210 [Candidatus Cloacimonetes bacterium]|jgi:hypothetical protein|nr:hypothetical protein [Candidatus Cloacimonadota bacterium]